MLKVIEKTTIPQEKTKTKLEHVKEKEESRWISNLSISSTLRRKINPNAPPELHQKIKEAISLLLAIKRYKSNSADPEADYVDNILDFIEGAVYGSFRIDGVEVIKFLIFFRSLKFFVYVFLIEQLIATLSYKTIYFFNFNLICILLLYLKQRETWNVFFFYFHNLQKSIL